MKRHPTRPRVLRAPYAGRAPRRPAPRRLGVAAAALALLAPVAPAGADPAPSPAKPGKTFAAYEYGWYPIKFVDHFETRKPGRNWEATGTGTVVNQNGMLTVQTAADGSAAATLRRHSYDRGRWEIRMRARSYESEHRDFTVAAELVPAGDRDQNCGAQNVALASFVPGRHRVRHHIRTLPDRQFTASQRRMNLSDDYWHTYAVEVTRKRISWFVDGRVRSTERRRAALSGVPLTLRLQLQAVPGETMNETRLQVDTVRYFTLKSPNDKPVRARKPAKGTYAGAC